MASAEPLLPQPAVASADKARRLSTLPNFAKSKKLGHRKMSIFYGVDEAWSEYDMKIKQQQERQDEIMDMQALAPDLGAGGAEKKGQSGKMLAIQTDEEGKSQVGKRAFPTPNKPDPMPNDLAFLFTKITSQQMMYLWNIYTALFVGQCSWVVLYCVGLRYFGDTWNGWCWCTGIFAPVFMELMVQNVYCLHDVLHGATFPPYKWQNYITHPWADILSLPWEDVVLEHQRHHASTVDLLIHGEFGWDPANWLYTLAEFSWLTVPLVPLWHWLGANDTGSIFALLWWTQFPDEGTGGKCNKAFWSKWLPTRIKHNLFLWTLWSCVWLLGTYPLNRPLSEGWRFMFTVLTISRAGFAVAWMFIANFNHSHMWNEFLASDPHRNWPVLHAVMAFILGGRHRFNEMLFHDLHHAFPNAVGALSQRGRFHGWKKVHDAATKVLEMGLWKDGHHANHAAGEKMRNLQQRRSSIRVNKAETIDDKYITIS